MSPSRHVVPLLAGVIAVVASGRVAVAVASDPATAEEQAASTDDTDRDADSADAAIAAIAAPMPVAFVEISGGASGALRSAGEAQTTWRYGRARGLAVDEAANRLRVSGNGRAFDAASHGLGVGFSVAIVVPSLRVGTYAGTSVAAAWARRDLDTTIPDIEWDASGHDAGPASVVVTVTSIAETSHSSERRGGVTVDVTDFRVHGSITATLPCTRSVAPLRSSCRSETIRGTF